MPAPYQILSWKDIRAEVQAVAPKLAAIIDAIDPGKDYPLCAVIYPYGYQISRGGNYRFPSGPKETVDLNDANMPASIKKHFSYADVRIPAGILLENSLELSVNTAAEKFALWKIFKPGDIFALWGYLDRGPTSHPSKYFNMHSGARSIFLAANVANQNNHRYLQKAFNLKLDAPRDLLDEGPIFAALANHPQLGCAWQTKLLLFSNKWIEMIKSGDERWIELDTFLLRQAWEHSAYIRNKLFYDYALAQTQRHYKLRCNPYLVDVIKHFYLVALGGSVAFAPARDDSAAPVRFLQRAYAEHYGLDGYTTTMLQPQWFDWRNPEQPVYFSLRLPNTVEFSPQASKYPTTLRDLKELKTLNNYFIDDIQSGWLRLDNMPIDEFTRTCSFDYFHNEVDREQIILSSKQLPYGDPNLITNFPKGDRIFPENGIFFRGCVRLSKKNK